MYGSFSHTLSHLYERETEEEGDRERWRERGSARVRAQEGGGKGGRMGESVRIKCMPPRPNKRIFLLRHVVLHGLLANNDTHRPEAFILLHFPL